MQSLQHLQLYICLNPKEEIHISDNSGSFSIPKIYLDDTLLITSVGYESIKVPAFEALRKSRFELVEHTKSLEPVTVKSFTSEKVIGDSKEISAYFRSWNTNSTGGEIGRIFYFPYDEYKIDRIRFKVNNRCDTCLLRLHIRNIVDGVPTEELLKDSIVTYVKSLTMDDKTPEFDLTSYNTILTNKNVYVGIEILNCKNKTNDYCSFCFVGTEKGAYVYKSRRWTEWEDTEDYSIYLKMYIRH